MDKSASRLDEIVDEAALRAAVADIAAATPTAELRARLVAHLKEVRRAGLAAAERLLQAGGGGDACAERLSHLQDVIVRALANAAVEHVYRADNPSKAERIALLAVGGYGRGTLAPGSDVDLLVLLPYRQTPWTESVVEFVLYGLWDMRLKVGHATRTVDECIRLARGDMTIRTALLEARLLWGEASLAEELRSRFRREVVEGTAPEFIAAKLAERDERHRRQGRSRYLVEPNVKEGKGGLRDLHTLFWIAKYFYRVDSVEELVDAGVFSRAEYKIFRKAQDFLWAVRCHLHFLTGKAEERVSFDVQRDLALRLGYTSHPGMRDVERFMKHYFLVAKDVGDLTRIFCARLEEEQVKKTPGLNRFLHSFRRKRTSLGEDFIVEHQRINVADDHVFHKDPVNLIRMFHLAGSHGLDFHPDAMALARRSLSLVDQRLRENPEANRLFIEILTSRKEPEIVLRQMSEAGVLGRFVREFGRVVALMQFNMYHHYTVDEHLLRCIGVLSDIDRGGLVEELPVASRLMPAIRNRRVLYVALFLHDIAKGRPEDHSIAGSKLARRLCPRFGFSPVETEQVAWLVQYHLTMSIVAQSRDLSDPKTIADFAAVVQSPERLKMLLILTVADIKAVGPGVWNGWKAQLLRTLYAETEAVVSGGHSGLSRAQRVEASKRQLAAALQEWTAEEREAYLARHTAAYWIRVDHAHLVEHARLVRNADATRHRFATHVTLEPARDITALTVLAPDHPRVLSTIAGACTVTGANIVDAQIFTTTDGLVIDSISISREFPSDEDEMRRAQRVCRLIERVLGGHEHLPEKIQAAGSRSLGKTLRPFQIEPEVAIDNSASDQFTMIEVSGLDRPGFLYDLTDAISDANLNIMSAHVATFGERAVDVFYVTDLLAQKVTHAGRQAAIRRRLLAAIGDRQGRAAEAGHAAAAQPVI